MVYTTYKNGDLGDGYYCFTHINAVVMHGLGEQEDSRLV